MSQPAYPTWRALSRLFLFRLLLMSGLLVVFSPAVMDSGARSGLTGINAPLASRILALYTPLVLLSGLGLIMRRPRPEHQVHLAIFIDLLTFTLIMHAGGGVTSGFGILLALTVAAGALMMEGRLSLLFAALAALAVITQQIYAQLEGVNRAPDYTQAGLLGILFFAVALLAHALYRRIRAAETLAARRQLDLADLSRLNDFIVRHLTTGILAVDERRRLRLINQAALELLDRPPAPPGTRLARLSPALRDWVSRAGGARAEGPLRLGERELLVTLQPLDADPATGAVLYLRDRREVLREARQVRLAALGTLTASIAHNIRNPLSAIAHAGQLLDESPSLTDDDRHLLAIVQRNCARIEDTVDSVLQLSRCQDRQPVPLALPDWLAAFAAEFRETRGLPPEALTLECAPAARDAVIAADPRHLRQILANLCDNALIHGDTPGHSARPCLRLARHEDGGIRIEVRDEGPGVAPALVPRLFDPFFTTRASGTGLGLYIARELAEANGLRLDYHPLELRGSIFRLDSQPAAH